MRIPGLRRLAGCALLGLVLSSGCTPAEPRTLTGTAAAPVAEQVFTVGFSRIAEIYVKPVDIGRLAVDGLEGLHTIDSAIEIGREADRVQLRRGGALAGQFLAPPAGDTAAWASLALAVVERGRSISPALRAIGPEKIYQSVFDAIMADLDPYSRYTGAQRAGTERAQREGYGGIGINVERSDGRTVVSDLVPTAPAGRAGLHKGEAILAIDDAPMAAMDLATIRERLRGPAGSLVTLTVAAGETTARQLPLRRERVIPNTVALTLDGGVAVLKVDRFNAATSGNLREAIREARAQLGRRIQGYVLDLRGNPGGLLDQAVAVADLFMTSGRIISTAGRHPDSFQQFDAASDDVIDGQPLVVLIDGRSASAAEIVAAALQDSGRAVVVGASSFGKGSVQTVTRLPNDGELFLTWSYIYAPSGYTLQKQGVTPTICTSRGDTDPEAVLAQLRAGRLALPPTLANWRISAPDDAQALAHLRETCPWKAHEPELDTRVARHILAERPLYQRAVQLSMTLLAER